jgi:allantoin racemase
MTTRRSTRREPIQLGVVIPVAESELVLRKIAADYDGSVLGADVSYYFAPGAPDTIASPADVEAAEAGVTLAAEDAASHGADAIIVACFSEPGVGKALTHTQVPVLGEGRPTLSAVGAIFDSFSIISASSKTIDSKIEMVAELGLEGRLRSVLPLDLPIEELTCAQASSYVGLIELAADQGAAAVVLGCTGLEPGVTGAIRAALPRRLSAQVTIVDPADLAGRFAMALAVASRSVRP